MTAAAAPGHRGNVAAPGAALTPASPSGAAVPTRVVRTGGGAPAPLRTTPSAVFGA